MANTTNYNWETPDDTDLVKDGAAAIRTLGSSIDTTTKALNPSTTLGDIEYRSATANTNTRLAIGTTGQVLTVAGGVPTWATSDDANAIQNSLLTTTGDTIYASGASTPARLGIGTTGQVLTVSGGIPSWATPAGGSGMTLLSTTTLSGATTTISSISTAYKNLFGVVFQATNATASGAFRIAPNGITNISTQLIGGVIKRAQYMLLATADNADTRPTYNDSTNAWTFQIDNYSSTTATVKPFQVYGSFFADQNGFQPTISGGGIENTTAITSLVFSNSGGNHNGGTVLLYGVA